MGWRGAAIHGGDGRMAQLVIGGMGAARRGGKHS